MFHIYQHYHDYVDISQHKHADMSTQKNMPLTPRTTSRLFQYMRFHKNG